MKTSLGLTAFLTELRFAINRFEFMIERKNYEGLFDKFAQSQLRYVVLVH